MRTPEEIKSLITSFATGDERVRAVLLNGSRANPNIEPDKFQDFDIVFIVNELAPFISDLRWTGMFGEKLISQLPDDMNITSAPAILKTNSSFHYLMQFTDSVRIDLTLFPIEEFQACYKKDSLTIVWLDKDSLFTSLPPPNESDYHIQIPTEKQFSDTCNEFWWVSINVAKGLIRNQITYSKEMMERYMRPTFMQLIAWKIGFENDFMVSFGKGGKFMKQYLSPQFYSKILETYADADHKNNWQSLFTMIILGEQMSKEIARSLGFKEKVEEAENTRRFIVQLYNDSKETFNNNI
jgi:aminoglycoside 6-adenylyltransferase